MNDNITIKDIAKELDISISTVSRALSDHPDIKSDTKKLVRDMADTLGYNPNIMAQSLKTKRTKTIGVIVPEIEHHFFSSALSGIEEVAYRAGYTMMVCPSNENYEREVININALNSNRVAGIIASISQTTVDGSHFQNLIDNDVPLVFFDRVIENINTGKVIINDEESAYKAVNYLIKKGYRRIAHFTGSKDINICKYRYEGYKQALSENGLKMDEDFIIYGGLHEQDGYRSFDKILKLSKMPDAIFAVNDPVAIGAIERIKEAGLEIPKDIAIVGFSNNPIARLITPKLTTVDQPAYEMGKKSAEMMIENLNAKDGVFSKETIVLNAELIIRDSA